MSTSTPPYAPPAIRAITAPLSYAAASHNLHARRKHAARCACGRRTPACSSPQAQNGAHHATFSSFRFGYPPPPPAFFAPFLLPAPALPLVLLLLALLVPMPRWLPLCAFFYSRPLLLCHNPLPLPRPLLGATPVLERGLQAKNPYEGYARVSPFPVLRLFFHFRSFSLVSHLFRPLWGRTLLPPLRECCRRRPAEARLSFFPPVASFPRRPLPFLRDVSWVVRSVISVLVRCRPVVRCCDWTESALWGNARSQCRETTTRVRAVARRRWLPAAAAGPRGRLTLLRSGTGSAGRDWGELARSARVAVSSYRRWWCAFVQCLEWWCVIRDSCARELALVLVSEWPGHLALVGGGGVQSGVRERGGGVGCLASVDSAREGVLRPARHVVVLRSA
ncbi:hypothetical protein C8J57DRAFT_1651445 [Mycena rebaudengoi]|nr:hypothetical protein C8J57DRAFT_1651445 [Mycena rebaudengoi]